MMRRLLLARRHSIGTTEMPLHTVVSVGAATTSASMTRHFGWFFHRDGAAIYSSAGRLHSVLHAARLSARD